VSAVTQQLPYGSWPSPITPDVVVAGSVSLGGLAWEPATAGSSADAATIDGVAIDGWLWWSELRPEEKGRVQLVRRPLGIDGAPVGDANDVLPDGFSARTRVHEYGGGAWWLGGSTLPGVVFFTSWDDQRLYRFTVGDDAPELVTPEPSQRHGLRFADGEVTPGGSWLICVGETHDPSAPEARNEIVALPTGASGPTEPIVLVTGPDFVSNPRVSPDGSTLCWIQWDHPNMPWDDTSLWAGELAIDEVAGPMLANPTALTPELGRSWIDPTWVDPDRLFVFYDPDDLWLLRPLTRGVGGAWSADPSDADVGSNPAFESAEPHWVFGQPSHCLFASGGGANVYHVDGVDRLETFGPHGGRSDVDVPYTAMVALTAVGDRVALIGASFTAESEIVVIDPTDPGHPLVTTVRPARDLGFDPAWFSTPRHIEFSTTDGATAYGFFHPPTNPEVGGPPDARPPLLVLSHGGPTGAARCQLQLSIEFWTSRGFGVVDVNYRGSVGYGRAFRDALHERWGIYDTDDCIAAARYLAEAGDVDGDRLAILGGSAGGYTTLCALTFHDDFAVGASLYGVADLEALAKDTHKFESRYLDKLIGPYPDDRATYIERSPIHHTDRLETPLIIFQGLEDEIVPPAQAEMMVDALRDKGVAFAYLPFVGEQHGFRQAANITRTMEAELYFFGQVLGFTLADEFEPVEIENL
jgi:dipeptidyl aminopeptidase/acylaminoacyl peptidase